MSISAHSSSQQPLPRQEELLLDYAKRLQRHTTGRRAVHAHLSRLRPHNRREHHLRIAASTFESLVLRHEGQSFLLQNSDIIVAVRDCSVAQIDETILRLRYLFSEDPLVHEEDEYSGAEAGTSNAFCTWYDLEKDYPRFLATASRMYDLARASSEPEAGDKVVEDTSDIPPEARRPLDPVRLGRLEDAIATSDLTGLIRRQIICAVAHKQVPKPVFAETYISIDELRRRLLPEFDLNSSRWLFQHLTEVLDARLMKYLPDQEGASDLSTSINLNLSTVLSEEFIQFDRALLQHTKKTMIIELQPIDVFNDLREFHFAREFARERGYKMCLDALDHMNFLYVRRDELKLDLLKVNWNADIVEDGGRDRQLKYRAAVDRAGPTRVILCHCDSRRAVAHGQDLGITMFQGRYIDRMVQTGETV